MTDGTFHTGQAQHDPLLERLRGLSPERLTAVKAECDRQLQMFGRAKQPPAVFDVDMLDDDKVLIELTWVPNTGYCRGIVRTRDARIGRQVLENATVLARRSGPEIEVDGKRCLIAHVSDIQAILYEKTTEAAE